MGVKYKKIFLIFLALPLFFPVIGCSTTPEETTRNGTTSQRKVTPEEEPCGGLPYWLKSHPADDNYFIGIGGSNSGDMAQDMETAKAKAMVSLAESISTQIRSEQTFLSREDSTGESYEYVETAIYQTVEQNLKQVETVDTWYCTTEGYWFYLRLSKAKWEEMKQEEINRVRERVASLVEPVLLNESSTVAERLAVLARSLSVIAQSLFRNEIYGTLNGKNGQFIDLVEKEVILLLGGLSLDVNIDIPETEIGRRRTITIIATSNSGLTTGQVPVEISLKGERKERIDLIKTNREGLYSGEINTEKLPLGKTTLIASIDPQELGIPEGNIFSRMTMPQKEFTLEVVPVRVALVVEKTENYDSEAITGRIRAILSKALPFQIAGSDEESRRKIHFTLRFRDAPENEYGIFISYVQGTFSVKRGADILYTFTTREYKDGGLTQEQARERALQKLFEDLEKNREKFKKIESMVSE